MPEYNNIQVHKRINDFNDPKNYDEFRRLVRELQIYVPEQFELNGSNWADLGNIDFLYFKDAQTFRFGPETDGIPIRPIIMGISHRPEEAHLGNWLSFDIVIHTDAIVDFETSKYTKSATKRIVELFCGFTRHFTSDPIFLTNEGSDSEPWHGLVESDFQQQKKFDLACFPKDHNIAPFLHEPGYFTIEYLGRSIIINERSWNVDTVIGAFEF